MHKNERKDSIMNKKTLSKVFAFVLTVCILLSMPSIAALADSGFCADEPMLTNETEDIFLHEEETDATVDDFSTDESVVIEKGIEDIDASEDDSSTDESVVTEKIIEDIDASGDDPSTDESVVTEKGIEDIDASGDDPAAEESAVREEIEDVQSILEALAAKITPYNAISEFLNKPYIVKKTVVIMSWPTSLLFDSNTMMPAYCVDYDRDYPDPDSMGNPFDPTLIFDMDTLNGLNALLMNGYPYYTGGLSNDLAQGYTQFALWFWLSERGYPGIKLEYWINHAPNDNEKSYLLSLMDAARNQKLPRPQLSAEDLSMEQGNGIFLGKTTVSHSDLWGKYTIDESKLLPGIKISGYTGNSGDVLTFTAPLSYGGQTIRLNDIFIGYDPRSTMNLFFYDNIYLDQQRVALVSILDTATVTISVGIKLEFPDVPNDPPVNPPDDPPVKPPDDPRDPPDDPPVNHPDDPRDPPDGPHDPPDGPHGNLSKDPPIGDLPHTGGGDTSSFYFILLGLLLIGLVIVLKSRKLLRTRII